MAAKIKSSKKRESIVFRRWNRYGNVVITRDRSGKILSWSKRRRGVSIDIYRDIYRRNRTFKSDLIKIVTPSSNTVEIGYVRPVGYKKFKTDKIPVSIEKRKDEQYIIRGYDKNKLILTVTSYKINNPAYSYYGNDRKKAVEWARKKFYENLDLTYSGGYDEQSGKQYAQRNITRIEEGWVRYKPLKKGEVY